jgi:serine/threonine protein phosphatase PrpC
MKLQLEAAGRTDVGLVRNNNEDNFDYDIQHGIFVLCDGMGGQAAGELASKIAVETVLNYFRSTRPSSELDFPPYAPPGISPRAKSLGNAVQLANQAIHEAAGNNPGQSGMGSTIVAVYAEGAQFSIANVGDSRIYLIRGPTIKQLTSDHSLVMEQVRRGLMTLEEAERSDMQNVIVRALGTEESVEADLADHELLPGDIVLLCSDGLSHYVKETSLLEVVRSTRDLEQACAKLIEAAKSRLSDDNITCLLLRAVERDDPFSERRRSWMGPSHRNRQTSS